MILVKTQAGQAVLGNRHGTLSPRQRSAFILFDGQRTLAQVLAMTASMGITASDVQSMVAQGLLDAKEAGYTSHAATPAVAQSPATAVATAKDDVPAAAAASAPQRSAEERYRLAYPVAVELVGHLGLRGFRLNLAVERAMGHADLVALAPKIREAVGEAAYERLAQALFA